MLYQHTKLKLVEGFSKLMPELYFLSLLSVTGRGTGADAGYRSFCRSGLLRGSAVDLPGWPRKMVSQTTLLITNAFGSAPDLLLPGFLRIFF
jgi:hypothetical protein